MRVDELEYSLYLRVGNREREELKRIHVYIVAALAQGLTAAEYLTHSLSLIKGDRIQRSHNPYTQTELSEIVRPAPDRCRSAQQYPTTGYQSVKLGAR